MNVPTQTQSTSLGYGRARLWLGISGVGTMVTLATAALLFEIPQRVLPSTDASFGTQWIGLVGFFALYALIQLPFDFLGGYWLPKQFGRSCPSLGAFAAKLLRGVFWHATLLLAVATLLMVGGRYAGNFGVVTAGSVVVLALLRFRILVATTMSQLQPLRNSRTDSRDQQMEVMDVKCDDEGFTGGIAGVLRPRSVLLPSRWREVLGTEGTNLAIHRRTLSVKTGSWFRGRMVAMLFTATGMILASLLVEKSQLGTALGIIQFSLWFSLWSFLGLLTLPTLSRRGVIEIDERIQADGFPTSLMRIVTERLDRLQDGESARPSLVETIFHPVPSVENRLKGLRSHQVIGYWDAARTTIYLSAAGLGLLGRAVHCNCGRPSLWVFLPTD